jgi:hypothetical protein
MFLSFYFIDLFMSTYQRYRASTCEDEHLACLCCVLHKFMARWAVITPPLPHPAAYVWYVL